MTRFILRSLLKLCTIVLAINYHVVTTLNMNIKAKLQVEPLWETVDNDNSPCGLERNDSMVRLYGSNIHSCRIHVTADMDSLTLMKLSDSSQQFQQVYIEREGNLEHTECSNRFVTLKPKLGGCDFIFIHNNLTVNVQGNGSVLVTDVSRAVVNSTCPETSLGTEINKNVDEILPCSSSDVIGYDDKISCDIHSPICRLDFDSTCLVNLGNREVEFSCTRDNVTYTNKKMLYFPISLTSLDIGFNNIASVDNGTFVGLRNLQILKLETNMIHVLKGNVFIELENLHELKLSYNGMQIIHEDAFRGLSNLAKLMLDRNSLESLPKKLFLDLNNLNTLLLRFNQLRSLEVGIFQGLGSLSLLNLYDNNMRTLPFGLFSGLYSLKTIYLERNELVELPTGLFSELHNVFRINLGYNELTTLPSNVLFGIQNIKYLYIYHNELVELPPDIFSGLNKLYILKIGYNRLKRLSPNLFSELYDIAYLYLEHNELVELPSGLFHGLHKLYDIQLGNNRLKTLPSNLFSELYNLAYLYVDNNEIVELPPGLFSGLHNLLELKLLNNKLQTLHVNIFSDLLSLTHLWLRNNSLKTLPSNVFSNLHDLLYLYIDNNEIAELPPSLFSGLSNLLELKLDNNKLQTLHVNAFRHLYNLTYLWLRNNSLKALQPGLFNDLHNIVQLTFKNNSLEVIHPKVFLGLGSLYSLWFSFNDLSTLDASTFDDLENLYFLWLWANQLTKIPIGLLSNLSTLRALSFQSNKLTYLDSATFKGLVNLQYLFLAFNKLPNLASSTFQDCGNLTFLDLSNNVLTDIPEFSHLLHLEYLNIRENPLTQVSLGSFSEFPNDIDMLVSQHEICECYKPPDANCSASGKRSPYLSCDRLLSDRILVVMMWLIGLNALVGNMFVLVWRKKNTRKSKFQDMLLSNLALSDFLMGVYMIAIASTDIYYGENFPILAESWRSGVTCKIAGAISIISSEASVFFVTLISIDRFIGIKYPMSTKKLGRKLTMTIIVSTWILSMALGIVPSALAAGEKRFKFYDISHVCIGLPLALTKSYSTTDFIEKVTLPGTIGALYYRPLFTTTYQGLVTGMYFSTALFLGLNCVCYLVILVCYVLIFRAVQKSSKQSGRTVEMAEQIKLTTKVTAIVATDFLCWFPIIILGILVQTRVLTLPSSIYAWAVTFVLPINSGINPYLYTISDVISNYRKKQKKTRLSKKSTKTSGSMATTSM